MSEPTSHYYSSARLKLHYVDWGNSQGPTLLLIHGLMDHCRNWDWLARALADRYHIIAPDLRGHGDSEWSPGAAYEVHHHIYDIAQLVEQRQLAPLTIIGHSLGGTIAAKFSGVWPAQVKRLVSIEGLGSAPKQIEAAESLSAMEKIVKWSARLQRFEAKPSREYATREEAVARMQQVNSHLSEERARHLAVHGSRRTSSGGYCWKYDPLLGAYAPFDMPVQASRQLWSNIDCPVLLIWGEDSWASDPQQDGRINYFKQAQLVKIPDAGHWVHHDQYETVMQALDLFLD